MTEEAKLNPNLRKLPKDWAKIIAEAYKEGCSDVEVRGRLHMTQGVWDNLYNDPVSSDFRQVVDFGHILSKAWWMSQGRNALRDKNFNANLWGMFMKNMWGWSEKTTNTTKPAGDLSDEELMTRVKNIMAKTERAVKA